MARDSVTTQKITRTGVIPALTAISANNDVIDAGAVILEVSNGGGSSINVTVVAVAAGATKRIGPFPPATFARTVAPDIGRVYVDYSATTSVTRAVVSL